ncbi:hypothetical protein P5673_005719 [Acropora cervicornis]|uniref:Uncharacterized protein n=1 Tax=Acropora cervicornis TaxID=6130 RepID=A0AAD9QYQ2_ACRCE|nr:hypothetical protein P5673_005719 [Acropora cervicornis]
MQVFGTEFAANKGYVIDQLPQLCAQSSKPLRTSSRENKVNKQPTLSQTTVSQQFHRELELQIDEDFNFTEIKVLLWYVSNGSRRFHVFLSNRVQEIQGSTHRRNPAGERHMKTDELPFER